MEVLKELGDTIRKMFMADLGLTLLAIAVVAVTAAGLNLHVFSPETAMIVLPAGALAALLLGVWRGSRK
jgi:hypothetical protein